ncbi:hypothetical protein B0A48_03905 [Cryoendolithus antarcticus]|uniref:F-box domain-containing protein n=1 Tax=Cryoendolithus antarcticus TaxID=1507870 RepID=A0A1V8TGU3_9PEZI|nr:hypothetical protein B0A48_03905 [Cryoendolithus antarcticus]
MPYRQEHKQHPKSHHARSKQHHQSVVVKPWWAVEEDGKPAIMLCGMHMRPKSHPALEDPVGAPHRYLWAAPEDESYRRALEVLEKQGDCLCDYTYFSELLKEREMADPTIKPMFPLMNLPTELRDEVHRHMLVIPGGVELCPVPYVRARTRNQANDPYAARYLEGTLRPRDIRVPLRRETIGQSAGIMRVNKRVHAAASRFCYSKNEFRFTNSAGWMGLDAFLYNIQLRNCSMLRSITVRHPDLLFLRDTCSTASTFWDGIHFRTSYGERFRERWFDAPRFDLKGLLSDAASCLQLSGNLKHLRIIVSEYGDGDLRCPVNETKFDELEVTFTSLDIPQTLAEFPSCFNYPKDRGPAYLEENWWAQKIVEASGKPGWKWQWLEADENGCYAGIKSRSMTTQADDELAEVTSALALLQ